MLYSVTPPCGQEAAKGKYSFYVGLRSWSSQQVLGQLIQPLCRVNFYPQNFITSLISSSILSAIYLLSCVRMVSLSLTLLLALTVVSKLELTLFARNLN